MSKNVGGRPTKLTPEAQELIVNAVRAGTYLETAAALAGVCKDTLHEWLKRGANSKSGIHKRFSDSVAQALAESEHDDASVIRKAAAGYDVVKQKVVAGPDGTVTTVEKTHEFSWQAAAWRLERRFPQRWGRRESLELTGDPEKPIEIKQTDTLDPAYMAKLLAAWSEAQLIAPELVKLIDVTPHNGNGQSPD